MTVLKENKTWRDNEINNLDFIKTVLMVLVILGHCTRVWNKGGAWFPDIKFSSSVPLYWITVLLGSFPRYAFVMVSGYLFAFLKFEKGKYSDYKEFATKKFKRLIIPYFFIGLFWAIPIHVLLFGWDGAEIVYKYVYAISPDALWFLVMLFGVYLIAYPLSSFFKSSTLLSGLLVLTLAAIGNIGNSVYINYFQIFSVLQYLLMFWLGIKLRSIEAASFRKIPVLAWVMLEGGLLVFYMYVDNRSGMLFALMSKGTFFLLNIIGSLMIWFLLNAVANRFDDSNLKKSRIYIFLKSHNFSMYLIHQQLLLIIIAFFHPMGFPGITVFVYTIWTFSFSAAISYILSLGAVTRWMLGQ